MIYAKVAATGPVGRRLITFFTFGLLLDDHILFETLQTETWTSTCASRGRTMKTCLLPVDEIVNILRFFGQTAKNVPLTSKSFTDLRNIMMSLANATAIAKSMKVCQQTDACHAMLRWATYSMRKRYWRYLLRCVRRRNRQPKMR